MKTLTLFLFLAGSALAQFTVAPQYVFSDPTGPCVNQNLPHQWSLRSFTDFYCSGTPGQWTRTGSVAPVLNAPVINNPTLNNPVVTGTLVVGTLVLDPVVGINDPVPALLPKYRLALGKTRAGVSDTKVLVIGDSTTAGFGAATTDGAYPARVAGILNAQVPSAPGLALPISLGTDARWTRGAGWAAPTQNIGFAANSCLTATAPTGNLVFAPGAGAGTFDSFDVYYTMAGAVAGTLTITATGGTPANIPLGGAFAVFKATVTAAVASNTNTVTISVSTGGNTSILGIEPFLSTAKKVRFGNAGVSGSNATIGWINNDFPISSLASITAYAPDLTIIMLGINDAGNSYPATTLSSAISTLITTAKASGDVILMTPVPSQNAPYTTFEALYVTAYKTLANANSVPLIELNGRWGAAYQSGAMTDSLHPNDYGYADMASAVASLLTRVWPDALGTLTQAAGRLPHSHSRIPLRGMAASLAIPPTPSAWRSIAANSLETSLTPLRPPLCTTWPRPMAERGRTTTGGRIRRRT